MVADIDTRARELLKRLRFWESDGHPHGQLHHESANLIETLASRPASLACEDCGLKYEGEHWVEAVVSDADWERIMPGREGGGILCINCMAGRYAAAGVGDIPVMLTAGPFSLKSHLQPSEREAIVANLREPSDAMIRAVDAACHERWPNARKMAEAMCSVIADAIEAGDHLPKPTEGEREDG